ncbi:hypothetical protein SAMN02982985_04257 [Rugamonas rubra]|uniref:Uncharacterized protein n=1 Tax=Rugamonas rubra TaxID=758825 RepID=A0A1I4R8V1_9BURK|nr:hypothetical protein SAMN02982985_04257 [Rugamonas rubra]
MSRLGIDIDTGLIYEGREGPTHPVWPTPPVCNATLIEEPGDLQRIPQSFFHHPFGWIFLETSFDFSARIRRGKLYQNFGNVNRETVQVEAHPAMHSDQIKAANNGWRVPKNLTVYCECTDLLSRRNSGEGLRMVLGQVDAASTWKIVQVERSIGSDIILTLRSESALGVLPELDTSRIDLANFGGVKSAYDRALDAAYRELPTSVVDQCRNAAVMFVSRWMQGIVNAESPTEQDLGAWIKAIRTHFGEHEKLAFRSALEIINKLHPRGKDNERHKMSLRTVDEDDAALAVHALGFILREIGWARH